MNFNSHSNLVGKHSFLSPSNYHWINYSDEKLDSRFLASQAAARGTALHNLAHDAIRLGVKLSKSDPTLSMYVNDAIGYKMMVEQPLYYSENCFGHVDTISFRKNVLRIHDLKTGITPASFSQLDVYAALFCLEYGYSPFNINVELRIYQNRKVEVEQGDPEIITTIMDRIIFFDQRIQMLKNGGAQ
jgi:hypothetical protein